MAGIFRKIFGGLSHREKGEKGQGEKQQQGEKGQQEEKGERKAAAVPTTTTTSNTTSTTQQRAGGGGFSVKVAVPADPVVYAPVVTQCNGNGGVQGLTWYAKELRADDDGDVAQEFLREIVPEARDLNATTPPCFEAVRHTRPVKLKGPVCTQDGNVHIS